MEVAVWGHGWGEGSGSHVTVWVDSIRGDYDNELNTPIIGTVLLNQLEDRNHHCVSKTMNIGWFLPSSFIH